MTDTSTFASLKVRDYLYLWIGMVGSAFSLNMQLVAQGWLVYEMTVSAMNLAWVTLAFMLPQVLFSLLGGVLADRAPPTHDRITPTLSENVAAQINVADSVRWSAPCQEHQHEDAADEVDPRLHVEQRGEPHAIDEDAGEERSERVAGRL